MSARCRRSRLEATTTHGLGFGDSKRQLAPTRLLQLREALGGWSEHAVAQPARVQEERAENRLVPAELYVAWVPAPSEPVEHTMKVLGRTPVTH